MAETAAQIEEILISSLQSLEDGGIVWRLTESEVEKPKFADAWVGED
jgi:hypothetical protein